MNQLIKAVVADLQKNIPVILPTDTLYALSVDATSEAAVKNLFQLKQRDQSKAVPVFVSSIEQALKYFEFTEMTHHLAKKFWPGALTLILNAKNGLAKNLSNTNKIAVRIPDNILILEIIKALQKPITGTSANISGSSNIFDYNQLVKTFQDKVQLIVEGKINKEAKPSTIVDLSHNTISILRIGAIPSDLILNALAPIPKSNFF